MITAFDTADVLTGHAHDLRAAGVAYAGLYTRDDRSPKDEVDGLASVGIRIWSAFERGNPTSADYFTTDQAEADAKAFLQWAAEVGQPSGTVVFWCVDYDSDPADIEPYFAAAHGIVKADGYLSGVYGNGSTCAHLKNAGLAHFTWLSQSTRFDGYQDWLPQADIIQGPSTTILGFDVDSDVVNTSEVCWIPSQGAAG